MRVPTLFLVENSILMKIYLKRFWNFESFDKKKKS